MLSPGGYYNSEDFGLRNDSIASIKVGAGAEVMLCEHDYLQGVCKTFRSSLESLAGQTLNGRVSSLLIQPQTAPAVPPITNPQAVRLIQNVLHPVASLSRKPRFTRDVVGILFDRNCAGVVAPTAVQAAQLLADADAHFAENSHSRFRLNPVGVLGPYMAKKPCAHYDPETEKDNDGDGFKTEPWEKYKEAIVDAAQQFDFSRYDRNGNKEITRDELLIVVLVPGSYSRGFTRPAYEREVPSLVKLKVNGVTITDVIVELYMNSAPLDASTTGNLAHELAHVFLNHVD